LHVWVVLSQTGVGVEQSGLSTQPTHFLLVGSHTGVVPGQSEFFVQVVPHVPVVGLQTGAVLDLQSALVPHCEQWWVVGLQTGRLLGQSAFVVQVDLHVFVVWSQTGFAGGQSAPVKHPTQVSVPVLQSGVEPLHAPLSVPVQGTQIPSGSLQTGVEPEQFASEVHPVVHVSEFVLQTPFAPVHCEDWMHWTHRFVVTLHTGVAPVHAWESVAVHWTQLPAFGPLPPRQAGVAGVTHAVGLPEPRSPPHGAQAPAVVSQIGFVGVGHWAFEVHSMQVCVVSLHTGLSTGHALTSPVVQVTHSPVSGPVVTHAGFVAAVQSWAVPWPRLPVHPTHVPVATEQNGVVPEHWASMMHATHEWFRVLQSGVGAWHWVPSRHWTHWLAGMLHFGVRPPQFESLVHPPTQV
jgi:hypothetical protein